MSKNDEFERRKAYAAEVAVLFRDQFRESGISCTENGQNGDQFREADPLHTDPLYNDVGYGPNPFRAESGPSHLPTAEEVAGRHELWQEAVTRPKG